ncbi:oligosaccharide repeat unit polymerase [Chryseobacterium daecheongense]|uniref:O-antigen polymerase n=1 Tax=Chryseobacterium daecheongense TaxID=192389 RepID=UPI001FD66AB5|nr:O-antigen polymerase [Chryseobacterium daecheongense]UOU96710.1 oligosaccharide repeat unit polymerase [Chryseobacterium daecheongense]
MILRSIYIRVGGYNLIFHPITISSIFFIIIHLLLPYFQWEESYFRYKKSYDIGTYILSIALTFLNFIIFIFGFFENKLVLNFKKFTYNPNYKILNGKYYIYYTFFIMLVGTYFVYDSLTYILSMGIENYMQDRLTLETGNGLGLLLSHWIYVATLIFLILFIKIKRGYQKGICIIFFIISFVFTYYYYSINSNRNSFFLLLLNILIFYLFLYKINIFKISLIKKSFLLLFIIISAFIFKEQGNQRQILKSNKKKNESLISSMNGAFGNHENIVWLMETKKPLLYGKTYVAGVSNFIPRKLWPGKPLGAGPILKNYIYPGSYIVGREGNSSLTTGFFTESLMNFGILGMLFFSFFYGKFLRMLYNKFTTHNNLFLSIFYLFILIICSSQFFYSEFTGFLARTIFTIIPFYILYKLNTKLSNANNKK